MEFSNLHAALDQAAIRSPEATAVVCGAASATYAELDDRSRRIATALQRLRTNRGDRVVVWMKKSPLTVASWFAALRTGAAYVPIDPSTPHSRARAIIERCRPTAVIVDDRASAPTDEWTKAWNWLEAKAAAETPADLHPVQTEGTDAAWIHFTSGSTGEPKGAAVSHRAATSYLALSVGLLEDARGVVANHAPLSFDLASFDVHLAAHLGTALHMVPELVALAPGSILKFLADAAPSILYTVPTTLNRLAVLKSAETETFPSLKALIFAGERPDVAALAKLRNTFPNATFHHWYGSTEAPLVTTVAFPPGAPLPDPLPLGKVVDNVKVALLDDDGAIGELAPGKRGELIVSGLALFDGYCNSPTETAKAFFEVGSTRWFHTRDGVSIDAQGDIFHQGRIDHVVKVSGMRVDPGEIEAAAMRKEGVESCAVLALPDPQIGARLYLLYTGAAAADDVMAHVRASVPKYMAPARAFSVPTIPFTASGKVDRRALNQTLLSLVGGEA